ncbi:MAG: alpha/beta hydrolase [Acidimicrobiaceae bacterium]|nr:alpha/beta hydrolase [Acidimicrobiaceae bacterium]
MNVLLIPGLWLDAAVWEDVTRPLRAVGHHVVAVSLPGQGDDNPDATLDDQIGAITAEMDAVEGPWVLVGHSAGSKLGWLSLDCRVQSVLRLICVGGFPGGADQPYFGDLEPQNGWVTFPGWEVFEGPDTEDLDETQRARFVAMSHPVSARVTEKVMVFHDPRRYRIPVTVICPEFTSAQAREWVDAGYLPEVEALRDVTFVDLDSGHWPMLSCPDRLTELLSRILLETESDEEPDLG